MEIFSGKTNSLSLYESCFLQLQSKKDFVIEQGNILWKGKDILQMSEKQKNLKKKRIKNHFPRSFG